MISLLWLLAKVLFFPWKYGVIEISTTDGMTVIGCGDHTTVRNFYKKLRDRHFEHIAQTQ